MEMVYWLVFVVAKLAHAYYGMGDHVSGHLQSHFCAG